jgi:hypothetical protein
MENIFLRPKEVIEMEHKMFYLIHLVVHFLLAEVVSLINITFRELQGNQLLLDEQKKHLERLQENLMRIGSVVSTTDVLIQDVPGLFQLGCFCMTELFAESFLRNLGSDYILDVLKNYKDSCEI